MESFSDQTLSVYLPISLISEMPSVKTEKYRRQRYSCSRHDGTCSTQSTDTVLCRTCVNTLIEYHVTIFFFTVNEALPVPVADCTLTCVNRHQYIVTDITVTDVLLRSSVNRP